MAYLHKKFKKLASSETPAPEVVPEQQRAASPVAPDPGPLKHSVGSMVDQHEQLRQEAEAEGRKNICPYCKVACPKPSVLEKHIRTHTNERPFPCDACGFAFKTKSNLYKHCKSRTHNLKVDQGITSTSEEIIAELGDTAKEELDVVGPLTLHSPSLHPLPGHHLPPRPPEPGQPLYLPIAAPPHHLVKLPHLGHHPDQAMAYPQAFHYGLPATFKEPNIRFLDPRALQPAFPLQQPGRLERPAYPAPYPFPQQELSIARYMQETKEWQQRTERAEARERQEVRERQEARDRLEARERQEVRERQEARERLEAREKLQEPLRPQQQSASDLSKKPIQQPINSASLEQRINKVISQNQAIVETLDPFWKGRYMRQSSRESDTSEGGGARGRGRRPSQSIPVTLPAPTNSQQAEEAMVKISRDSTGNSVNSLPSNMISGSLPHPPRPDSNIPLNLSEPTRKRKSPSENVLADAHSVRDVWVNSLKKTGSISKMEEHHSNIEAKLGRNEDNVFHPENPEGSIIKDLLLKTRAGLPLSVTNQALVASTLRESELKEQDDPTKTLVYESPMNLQISIPGKPTETSQGLMGIPVPKNILSQPISRSSVESQLYQCNLCMVTFKSLESIEIHQTHYCKNSKVATEGSSGVVRPNSTVTAHPRPSPGERRKSEAEGRNEPVAKRSRSESLPVDSGPVEVSTYGRQLSSPVISGTSTGLLQIARPRAITTSSFNLTGIPTPNLSGVLTGIKAVPLFSLPGVRPDLMSKTQSVDLSKVSAPLTQSRSASVEEKPVTFVLGIPGPYSSASYTPTLAHAPTRPTDTLVTFSTATHCISSSQSSSTYSFMKPLAGPSSGQSPVKEKNVMIPKTAFHSPLRKPEFGLSPKTEVGRSGDGSTGAAPEVVNKPERPLSLPLVPGGQFKRKDVTFSGATLISPETPRPKKAYVLHYQNGTAYTFLGLKCSTRVFFCSIHKAQPNYVELEPNSRVSMYSNWKVVSKDSHPSGLSPKLGMSCYNSSYQAKTHGIFTTAAPKKSLMITTHSSRWQKRDLQSSLSTARGGGGEEERSEGARPLRMVEGGYKSADDNYTYIRGRGRGKYICDSCGIRCKKPSMLKKHIRTHTNVRPFTCKYCNFSFKTKVILALCVTEFSFPPFQGNLTKHMKSKTHSKKCVELGIIPVPTSVEENQLDDSKSSEDPAMAGDSDTDDCEDADDMDEEDEDDCLTEQEMQEQDMERRGHNPRHYEDSSGLGLASFAPRFSCVPYVSAAVSTLPPSPGRSTEVIPNKPASNIPQIPEYEQVCRITRLAAEVREDPGQAGRLQPTASRVMQQGYYFSTQARNPEEATSVAPVDPSGTAEGGSKIWSIATLTDPAESTVTAAQAKTTLSDAEPSNQQKYEAGTGPQAVQPREPEPGPGPCDKGSLQEQEAVVPIKEEPMAEEPRSSGGPVKVAGLPGEFGLSYSHAIQGETIPQNVTMNVKDMPALNSTPGQSQPAPEFNIPHITKADSPLRKAGVESLKGRAPEVSTSESPSTSSSQESEAKDTEQKGSQINKTQEIFQINEEGKSVCGICKKVFSKPSQLRLHVNIHYFERPFRCEACAVSFRTKGHLQKHKRSVGHFNKVNINATFGAPSTDNPRPFKCGDCMIAFRIHGHLAKHLRSKMHIMKLECIGKLPIGMYAEMERLGTNLNEIDTTDCENSLESLQVICILHQLVQLMHQFICKEYVTYPY